MLTFIGLLYGLIIYLSQAPKKKEKKEKQRIWRRGEIIRGRERVEFLRSLHENYAKKIDEDIFYRRFKNIFISKKHTKSGDVYFFTPEKGCCSKKESAWFKFGFSVEEIEHTDRKIVPLFEQNEGIRCFMAQQDEAARAAMREQDRLHIIAHERAMDYFDRMSTGIEFGGTNPDINLNPGAFFAMEKQIYENISHPAPDYSRQMFDESYNSPSYDSFGGCSSFDFPQPDYFSSFDSLGGGFDCGGGGGFGF